MMKLIKKALAVAFSLAMTVTAMSALSVTVFASENPTLAANVTVDESAKTASVSLTLKDIPETVRASLEDGAYIANLSAMVDIDAYSDAIKDGTIKASWIRKNVVKPTASLTLSAGTIPGTGSGSINMYLANANIDTGIEITDANFESVTICTINNIPLTDAALKNGFKVDLAGSEDPKGAQVIIKNIDDEILGDWLADNKGGNTLNVVDGSWKPATTEDPKPDYVYDDKDPSATNWKAADTDFAPQVYEGTDGSKAVAVKATVNPGSDNNTYKGLVWKVVKKADNKAYTYTQDINITGAADFVYGLVIGGATEDDVDLNSFGVAVK